MKNKKLKYCMVISIIFLILCCIIISNCKIYDMANMQEQIENITLSNETVSIEINPTQDELLKELTLQIPESENEAVIYYNLTSDKGYYLKTATDSISIYMQGEVAHIVFENKLNKDRNYKLELALQDTSSSQIATQLVISYAGYKNLSRGVQAVLMIICIFVVLMVLLALSENTIYLKCRNYIFAKIYNLDSPKWWEYLIVLLFFVGLLMSNADGDSLAFVHYEVNFWRSIFYEGGIENFYDFSYKMEQYYKANAIGGAFAAYYDFPMFIILGIWGLPLYMVCETLNIEETSNMWTIVYGKSVFIIAVIAVAYCIYKICVNMQIRKEYAKWAVFLFVSSLLVFVDTGYIGQVDIIGITFILLGIYFYQKKSRWKFVLFFMIASSFKQFPVFIFILLLLLIEKNIVKIVIQTLFVVGFSKVIGLLFPSDTMAITVKNEFSEKSLETLLGVKVPLYNDTVPIIILLFGGMCVYCYLKKVNNQKELEEFSIWLSLLSMFILLISFDSNPYWYIQLAPYLAILMMYNVKKYNQLILFETVGIACVVLNQFGANYWCFDPSNGEGMLLSHILGIPNTYFEMDRFCAYTRLNSFSGVFFGGFVVCIAAFLWLCRPGRNEQARDVCIRPYALLRVLCNAGIAYIPAFLYVLSFVF